MSAAIRNQDGETFEVYARRCQAQLVTPMTRQAWERELATPAGVCDCCGQDVGRLHTVQIGRHTDRLCDGCVEHEVGPGAAR